MTYKEVFQLAQDKGYFIRDLIVFETPDSNIQYLNDRIHQAAYIEICLIQKWLRDEHKIVVTVELLGTSGQFKFFILNRSRFVTACSTYEEALLNGINEALKLIL